MGAGTVASAAVSTPPTDWLRLWLWWPSYGLLVLVALLFPSGRAASPRWRPVVRAIVGALLVGVAGLISLASRAPGLLAGDRVVAPGWDTIAVLGATAALLVGTALAVVSLVVRIVRASTATRGPLLWAGVNSALLLAATVLDTVEGLPLIWLLGALAAGGSGTAGAHPRGGAAPPPTGSARRGRTGAQRCADADRCRAAARRRTRRPTVAGAPSGRRVRGAAPHRGRPAAPRPGPGSPAGAGGGRASASGTRPQRGPAADSDFTDLPAAVEVAAYRWSTRH